MLGSQNKTQWNILTLILMGITILGCKKENLIPSPEPSPQFKIIETTLDEQRVIIVGDRSSDLFLPFYPKTTLEKEITFVPTIQNLPIVMEDESGGMWDAFGECISGENKGMQLLIPESFMSYWFTIAAHYPEISIFPNGPDPQFSIPAIEDSSWAIPKEPLVWGSSWDGIRPVDNPIYLEYKFKDFHDNSFFLEDNDLVIGLKVGSEIRAYPHPILNWHEIVNTTQGGKIISISYCPLAGTSQVWEQDQGSFGVSGLLYNNNLLMFDRKTESIWSQILGHCVYGDLKNARAKTIPFLETSWKTWKKIQAFPIVLSDETGVNINYSEDQFKDYKEDEGIPVFPIFHFDTRIPPKERVLVLRGTKSIQVFRRSMF